MTLVTSAIARLRAEYDATSNDASRASLLHEIGVLEERLGDEAASARDQLAAVNLDPDFREPLERLIAIIERRQSYKNLGKLLERLVRVSDAPEDRARALLDQAFYLWDHDNEPAQARMALEQAAEEAPKDSAIWLALEVLAGKQKDPELRERSLASRAELATDPVWRALLFIDLAELRAEAGNFESARSTLEMAIDIAGPVTFAALCVLEKLGERAGQSELSIRALLRRANLILESMKDPAAGDAVGVPRYCRSKAHAADAFLQASELKRKAGDATGAAALLDEALEHVPNAPLLVHARINAAEAVGDASTAAKLARAELERGLKGEAAAARYLRVAEAAAAEGDGRAALDAVEKALAEDKGSIPARALELDLLSSGHDPQALAAAIEACAEQFPSDEAKARLYLVSADVWARQVRDAQGARAALSQAGMFGAAPSVVARVARMLAALTADLPWFEEATRRLIAQGSEDNEQPGLWFELARLRAARGDRGGALQALEGLANAPGGSWLGNALLAYAAELLPEPDPAAPRKSASPLNITPSQALRTLADSETDPASIRALSLLVVLRALLRDDVDAAVTKLQELCKADTSDVVSAAALAALEGARGNTRAAATTLASTADAVEDAALSAALWLEAGIRHWQAGARADAVQCFTEASERAPRAGGHVLGWALCAAEPDDASARRRALDAAKSAEPALAELERFTLEVGKGGDAERAETALAESTEAAPVEIKTAFTLARALWGDGDRARERRRSALDALAETSPACAGLARAAAFQLELAEPDSLGTVRLEDAGERWAKADGSLAASVEWLAGTLGASNLSGEVSARRALAARLSGPAAAAVDASASVVAQLANLELAPPLHSDAPAAKLVNLELAAPGGDPRRRAHALLDIDGALGDEAVPAATALAGYNQLAYGDAAGAMLSFRRVVEAFPEELIGWEGLRTAAERLGDRATLAEACAALGDAVQSPGLGAQYWERAAMILLDELNDPERGEFALSRAVDRDVRRFDAFDRLFRIVRGRKDGQQLLELIGRRLQVADEPEEIAKLFWERARVLREAGDREGALAALENVRLLEPDHVGALALSGEIYLRQQRFEEAAENLAKLATLSEAPAQQRLMSGVAAVDVYENKLGNVHAGLEVLISLYRAGLSTQPVRERLARVAAKAERWELAIEVLEKLMIERDSSAGRIEAARLAMAIYRDRLRRPAAAESAVVKLLDEAPDDAEALDLVLSGVLPKTTLRQLLSRALSKLVATLIREPLDTERVERMARVAEALQNAPLRQATLGAVVALGMQSRSVEEELFRLDERVAHVPQVAVTDEALPNLADPDDTGPIPELMRAMAITIAAALGPSLAGQGVTKRERVDPRMGLPVRNEIAAWAGALGIGEFELYIGGRDPDGVTAIATELPALVIGERVGAPLSPAHRQAVARELFALRRGTTVLRHREPAEIAALVVATCRVVEVEVPSPAFAMLGEFQRQLGKEMSRRVRKLLPSIANRVADSGQDPLAWYTAATSSLDRMAAIAAGDVSWVLGLGGTRGRLGASREAQARARRLLSFVLSPVYLALREQLGMGVR